MEFDGAFYNPEYRHEGFSLNKQADGTIIGYFFSYMRKPDVPIDNQQLWVIGVGKRIGNKVVLDVGRPLGGDIGNPEALAAVVEYPWGTIVLTDQGTNILAEFKPNGDTPWQYPIQPVYKPSSVLNEIKIELLYGTNWIVADTIPLEGSIETISSRFGSAAKSIGTYRITVVKGTLNITDVYTSGFGNPKIVGVKKLDVYNTGDTVIVKIWLGPLPPVTGTEHAYFAVKSAEFGIILRPSSNIVK